MSSTSPDDHKEQPQKESYIHDPAIVPKSENLPRELSYGEQGMLWDSGILDFIGDVRWMAVSDTLGKSWRVPRRHLRLLRKQGKQGQS